MQAEQLVAPNMVRPYTICLDMTISRANYRLVYRLVASELMFSRHACLLLQTPPSTNTHKWTGGRGRGRLEKDREEGWRARGKAPHPV